MGVFDMRFTPYTSSMGLSGLPLQFAIASIATCAFWLFGYDMSVMGGVITEEPFLSVFPSTTMLPFKALSLPHSSSALLSVQLFASSTERSGQTRYCLAGHALHGCRWHTSSFGVACSAASRWEVAVGNRTWSASCVSLPRSRAGLPRPPLLVFKTMSRPCIQKLLSVKVPEY